MKTATTITPVPPLEADLQQLFAKVRQRPYEPSVATRSGLKRRINAALHTLSREGFDTDAALALFAIVAYYDQKDLKEAWRNAYKALRAWLAQNDLQFNRNIALLEVEMESHIEEFFRSNSPDLIGRRDAGIYPVLRTEKEISFAIETAIKRETLRDKAEVIEALIDLASRPVWILFWDVLLSGRTVSKQLERLAKCIYILRRTKNEPFLHVVTQISSPDAEERIRRKLSDLGLQGQVFTGHRLSNYHSIHNNPRLPAEMQRQVEAFCRDFYTRIVVPASSSGRINWLKGIGPFGYADTETCPAGWVVVRYKNAPNNSVPPLWYKAPKGWDSGVIKYGGPFPRDLSNLSHKSSSLHLFDGFRPEKLRTFRDIVQQLFEEHAERASHTIVEKANDGTTQRHEPTPFVRDLVRELYGTLVGLPPVAKAEWINVYGETGHGKSQILYSLRLLIRRSDSLVDCLIPLPHEIDDRQLEHVIIEGVGGHERHTKTPAILPELDATLTQFNQAQKRVVFLIDHCERAAPHYLEGLLLRLASLEPAAVICASRSPLGQDHALRGVRFDSYHYVDVFSIEEFQSSLEAVRDKVPEEMWNGMLSYARSSGAYRHPVVVNQIIRRIKGPISSGELHKFLDSVTSDSQRLACIAVKDICERHTHDRELAHELVAAVALTADVVRHLATTPITSECEHALLEELYWEGFVSRTRPLYWLKDYYAKALMSEHAPSCASYERLLLYEEQRGGFSFDRLKATLAYVENAGLTKASKIKKINDLIGRLAAISSGNDSFPADPSLAKYFGMISEEAGEEVYLLHALYLECQGLYPEALGALEGLNGDHFDYVRMRALDKLGRFQDQITLLEERLGPVLHTSKISTVPPWTPELCFYYGRYVQATGSLGKALESYSAVEAFDSAHLAVRIHAMIEQATIWVFAEEPQFAIAVLDDASRLVEGSVSLWREKADLLRYKARAAKLLAYQNPQPDESLDLISIDHYIEQCERWAEFYAEGRCWSRVLRGRTAYFRKEYGEAVRLFNDAAELVEQYAGGLPHILRHRALAYCMQGELFNAKKDLSEAQYLARESQRRYLIGLIEDTWGKVLLVHDRVDDAALCFEKACLVYMDCGLMDPPFSKLRQRFERIRDDPKAALEKQPPW